MKQQKVITPNTALQPCSGDDIKSCDFSVVCLQPYVMEDSLLQCTCSMGPTMRKIQVFLHRHVKPFWLHAPRRGFHWDNWSSTSNAASSSLYTSMNGRTSFCNSVNLSFCHQAFMTSVQFSTCYKLPLVPVCALTVSPFSIIYPTFLNFKVLVNC